METKSSYPQSSPSAYPGPLEPSAPIPPLPSVHNGRVGKKRMSLANRLIRVHLKIYARDRRKNAVNGWGTTSISHSHGYLHGLIAMANACGSLSEAKEKRLMARLDRVSFSKITRLDQRLAHGAKAS